MSASTSCPTGPTSGPALSTATRPGVGSAGPHAFIAAHTGNIGLKQDLGNLVEAARLFDADSGAQILVIGDGNQRAAIAQQATDVAALHVLDPLDDESYPLALAAADVLLINERPSVGDMSLPSKLTSYLAAGRPVLAAVADDGATAAELHRTKGAGHVVPPGDPKRCTALRELRVDVGRRAAMSTAALRYADETLGTARSMSRLADSVLAAVPRKPRELRRFTPDGYDKGRNKLWQIAWFASMNLVFMAWWFPARFRPTLLRLFGAQVGRRVLIRHRVRVLWPWKLSIGNDCWIGEDAWLLNLEPITIEDDVCLSQGAFLCTGSHNYRKTTFGYDNGPIHIGSGAWIAARATVLRGSRIDAGRVVPSGVVCSERGDHSRTSPKYGLCLP
ncbi:MAG: glycosyltransferase [Kineosporiaceae bacterium]